MADYTEGDPQYQCCVVSSDGSRCERFGDFHIGEDCYCAECAERLPEYEKERLIPMGM